MSRDGYRPCIKICLLFHFMSVCLHIYVDMQHVHACYPRRPEEHVRNLGTDVVNGLDAGS